MNLKALKAIKALYLISILAALSLSAFTVEQVHPVDGVPFNVPTGGKLAAVQVFSPTASGSVALKSIWSVPVYTNAVAVESLTVTNITVVSSNRTAATTRTIAYPIVDSIVTYTNAAFGTVHTVTNMTTAYTNIPVQVVFTNAYALPSFSFAAWQSAHPLETLLSTNTAAATTATTNRWPVLKQIVAVTNSIASGTCSGGIFTNAPASSYLAPGETLLFTGTATGGFLRLIFE